MSTTEVSNDRRRAEHVALWVRLGLILAQAVVLLRVLWWVGQAVRAGGSSYILLALASLCCWRFMTLIRLLPDWRSELSGQTSNSVQHAPVRLTDLGHVELLDDLPSGVVLHCGQVASDALQDSAVPDQTTG